MSARSTVRSGKSSISSGSKRSRPGTYRTISRKSVVDESLFGKKQEPKMKEPKTEKSCSESCKGTCHQDNKCIRKQIIGAGGIIREIVIPRTKMRDIALILKPSEYQKLRNKSTVLSKENELKFDEQVKQERDMEAEASQLRRLEMKKIDMLRNQNQELSELELEAQKNAQSMLSKAIEAKQEQEDEIKELSKWIQNAKIQAIRDAQILEKEQIKKEILEEEKRLDKMMEIERKNAIAIQEAIDGRKKEVELKGAVEILKQISSNAEEKLIKQERNQQENEAFNRQMNELMEEELKKRVNKREKQARVKEQLDIANQAMLQKKQETKEMEALMDEKIRLIQQEKADREAQYEAEQRRIKAEKERELAKLRGTQERQRDEQAEKDGLRARRATEAQEREWRRKELEAAKKKADSVAQLKYEHACQVEFKRQLKAIQAERERREFENILNLQKQLIAKDGQDDKKLAEKRFQNAADLRKQICEKEQERIAERNAFFEEGVRLAEEARLRRIRIEEAKERKFKEFLQSGLPAKYLNMVEERVKAMNIN